MTKLKSKNIPNCDILIAGFPCQSYSIQGLRKGLDDERGQIIYYLRDILKAKKIKYFILENVKGLTNVNQGKTLKIILNMLRKIGYKVFWQVLDSSNYGLPQKRERIYLVGIRKDLKCTEFEFPKTIKKAKLQDFLIEQDTKYIYNNYEWLNKYLNNKYNLGKFNLKKLLKEDYLIVDTRQSDLRLFRDFVPTLRTGRSGILYVKKGRLRKLSGREALLLQGFGKRIFNKAEGLSNTLLLQQAGNAMSVKVIFALAKELKKVMEQNGDLK